MSKLTIDEIKTLKQNLESNISKMISEFEQTTGLSVIGFDEIEVLTYAGQKVIHKLGVKVEL